MENIMFQNGYSDRWDFQRKRNTISQRSFSLNNVKFHANSISCVFNEVFNHLWNAGRTLSREFLWPT